MKIQELMTESVGLPKKYFIHQKAIQCGKTKQVMASISNRNSPESLALSKAILAGKVVVTEVTKTLNAHDFPRFTMSGAIPEFGMSEITGLKEKRESTTKHTMHKPNENKIVHELARELVEANNESAKLEELTAIADKDYSDASNDFEGAQRAGEKLRAMAHLQACEMLAEADKDSARKAIALKSAREKLQEAAKITDSLKASLSVARLSSDEDIELIVGAQIVHVSERQEGGEGIIEVSVMKPARVKRIA